MVDFEYAIALSGGIATGKSTVANYLLALGYDIIDADKIAHQVLEAEKEAIARLFGEKIIKEDKVDRVALGNIIFNDAKQKLLLENLLHPKIYRHILSLSKEKDKQKKLYFVDIPLFFESKRYAISKSILVYTTKEIQIQRLMQRDKCSQEEAKVKISNQLPIDEKRDLASLIIENNSSKIHLEKEVYENHKIFCQWK